METIHFTIGIAPIKIIFTVFALFAWSRALLKFRKQLLSIKELIFWSVLWVSMLIFVYIPGKSTLLARLLGMNRGLDALLFFSVVALFYAVYRLYVKLNEAEQEITELVRQISLRLDTTQPKKRRRKA